MIVEKINIPVRLRGKRRPGTLYLMRIAGTDVVKCGITRQKKVENRLKQLQRGRKHKLELIWSVEIPFPYSAERAIHETLSGYRICHEWFLLSNEEVGELTIAVIELVERLNSYERKE